MVLGKPEAILCPEAESFLTTAKPKNVNENTLGENYEENRNESNDVCLPVNSPRGVGGLGKFCLHRQRHWHRQSVLRSCLNGTRRMRGAERQVRHHGQ